MTLDEMKLAVCEKLPELIEKWQPGLGTIYYRWKKELWAVHWPTEGLQVCHEAERLLTQEQLNNYFYALSTLQDAACYAPTLKELGDLCCASYEQRLEALCRVWYPERFN